jgi:uncharacterized protein (DUF1697 family)
MKYLALLRGINVGGKNIIKMTDLKKSAEKCIFSSVRTYIQSGNILFESEENNTSKIVEKLEIQLLNDYAYNSRIVVKSFEQLKTVIAGVPSDWDKRKDLRCYIAFIGKTVPITGVLREFELQEGIDFIQAGEGVLYMSTLLSGLTRSRLSKIITKEIYKDITIRNYNTARKLLELME